MDRRVFLRALAALSAVAMLPRPFVRAAAATAVGGPGPYGPLLPPDVHGLMLPEGFTAREIARSGSAVAGTGYVWPAFPDGGACFRARGGGWIYAANSEQLMPNGGVSAIRFDRNGAIAAAYAICTNTARNCAGGATPWRTWLTCEEVAGGSVWECDPTGAAPAVRRPALGTFQHEAVAVARDGRLYLTEDQPDGRFYRFTPTVRGRLDAGTLEVATVENGAVRWSPVPNPNPTIGLDTPTREQVPTSTPFNGGEGIATFRRHVYFATKGDDRIWDYEPGAERLAVLYDAALDPAHQLTGVDNVAVSRSGDVFVAEDPGNLELVMLTPGGIAAPLLRVVGQNGSELAGPAFDPKGGRLYVSSQRGGGGGQGITYEITGPFRRRAPRA